MFTIYILISFILSLVFSLIFYKKEIKKKKTLSTFFLVFFRFLTIFFLLILILNPLYERDKKHKTNPNLFVFFDNSESIKSINKDSLLEISLKNIKNNNRLNTKYKVNYIFFGENINYKLDSLKYNEKSTDISNIYNFIKENVTENDISVIYSDGIINKGSTLENFTKIEDRVIYTVFVGDTIQKPDISIHKIVTNNTTRTNNKFPVKIFIKGDNVPKNNYNISVYNRKKKVHSFNINNSEKDFLIEKEIYLSTVRKGINKFNIRINPISKEFNIKNNTKNFTINSIDNNYKILCISSGVYPEIGFFKNIISNNSEFDFEVKNINEIKSLSLKKYNFLIIINPDNNLEKILNKLRNKNILWVLSKEGMNTGIINKFYNKNIISSINLPNDISNNFNDNFKLFNVDNKDNINYFPPLKQNYKLDIDIPFQKTILYKKIKEIDIPNIFFYNNKSMFVLLEGIWKWRLYDYKINQNFNFINNFFYKISIYLSNDMESNIFVDFDPIYELGEDIIFNLNYFNRVKEKKISENITITIRKDNFNNTYKFKENEENYNCLIRGLDKGEYNFIIRDENIILYKNNFIIEDKNLEYVSLKGNIEGLETLSKKHSGENYLLEKDNSLIKLLENKETFSIISYKKIVSNLQNSWIILLIISVSIFSEWIIRKFLGML